MQFLNRKINKLISREVTKEITELVAIYSLITGIDPAGRTFLAGAGVEGHFYKHYRIETVKCGRLF